MKTTNIYVFVDSLSWWVDNHMHFDLVNAEQSQENTNPGTHKSEEHTYLSI